MMKKLYYLMLISFFISITKSSTAQSQFELEWEYDYTTLASPYSLNADVLGRPYLYAASAEAGLRIFTTSGVPVFTVDTNMIEMSAMNFTQSGNLLYVAIGRHGNHDKPGLAIIDVSNPAAPIVKDVWVHPPVSQSNGSAIVKVEGNYAYLGAMGLGLVILNVSDPNNIAFVSELALDINYPVAGPNPNMYNLRGMEVKNSVVYGCFDAGGIRIINCTDKLNPRQTGKFANPVTYQPFNMPRAYNNIVLNDTVAYVAVDYCGLEVLRISDTSNITLLDHWNIHNCPSGSWFNAPVHANELQFNSSCKELFMTTGKSEMISMDVSDPTNVDSTGMYGSIDDTTATWGLGMRNDSIFLSYMIIPIYVSWIHPFDAKWNGIKMIRWTNPCAISGVSDKEEFITSLKVQPNPFSEKTQLFFRIKDPANIPIRIYDLTGRTIIYATQAFRSGDNIFDWDGKDNSGNACPAGIYFMSLETPERTFNVKVLKSR
jgi:hypothetical protein